VASPRTHRIPRPLAAGALFGVLVACLGALSAFAFLHLARASAEQITVGPEGDVWFTEPGVNAIGRITPQGSITQFPIATPDSAPSEIATGPDGDLWFTQAQADEIGSITPEGTIRELRVRTPSVGIAAGR
jgi:virginiamycin B lyase